MIYLLVLVLTGVLVLGLYCLFGDRIGHWLSRGKVLREARRKKYDEERQKRCYESLEAQCKRRKEQERTPIPPPAPPDAPPENLGGLIMGVLFVIAGVVVVASCLAMEVTATGDVINLDLLNQRLCGTVIGVGLFVAGCVLIK